jgi:hypothetical protein
LASRAGDALGTGVEMRRVNPRQSDAAPAALDVSGLAVHFGGVVALEDVSISLQPRPRYWRASKYPPRRCYHKPTRCSMRQPTV